MSTFNRSTEECHRTDVLREAMGRCLCYSCVERDKPTTLSVKITARKSDQMTEGPLYNGGCPAGPRSHARNTLCSQIAHDCPPPSGEGPEEESSNSCHPVAKSITYGPTVSQGPTEIRGKEPCRGIKSTLAHAQLDIIFDSDRCPCFLEDECLMVIHEIYWWPLISLVTVRWSILPSAAGFPIFRILKM